MSKISFLIATRNRGELICETLESLLKQDISEWEAIIVDDHGSDNTKELIEKYNEKRFRYFCLNDAHGRGASCARNFGIIFADSEIISILDSDDLAYPHRARVTVEAFGKDPELDVFYSSFDMWNQKTGEVFERFRPPVYDFSIEKMKEKNYIPHCTLAIKKDVLLSNPYNQYFKIAEDYEMTSRLACAGKKFFHSKERLTKYRIAGQNISIGAEKDDLVKSYDMLVKMVRGWVPFDKSLISKIEELENLNKEKI